MALVLVTLASRLLLVALFLPCSAADKLFNFSGATEQARQAIPGRALPALLILCGLGVEIGMSLCVLTGFHDRLAAFILAGYCGVTALLWKQFWKPGDFWAGGKGRALFWDFMKNFALAGGFLMLTLGPNTAAVHGFLADPLSSTHPYTETAP